MNIREYLNHYNSLMKVEKNKGIEARINPRAKRTKPKKRGRR